MSDPIKKRGIGGKSTTFYGPNDINIGPICLPASGQLFPEGEITVVGWGSRYSEVDKNRESILPSDNKIAVATSCTTNEFGPTAHRFKHCSLEFLKKNGMECVKTEYNTPFKSTN